MRIQRQAESFSYRVAGYYTVTLKLQDGTIDSGSADIGSQAVQVGNDLASKHGLTLGPARGGPDDIGRSPTNYPVYDHAGNWKGKVLVEHDPDLVEQGFGSGMGSPFGPHQDSYAYARVAGIQDDTYDDKWKGDAEDAAHHGDPPGFTMRDRIGDGPTSGYMYSIPGHEDIVPTDQATGDYYADYAHQNNTDLIAPGHFMGTFPEDNTFATDVSEQTEDPWVATEKAHEYNQRALYDLNNKQTVYTDEAPTKLYPEQPGLGFWMGQRHG